MQKNPVSDIQYLKGVGEKRARLLESELGVHSAEELIRIYPYKYIDRSTILPIAGIQTGIAYVQVRGTVLSTTLFNKSGQSVNPTSAKQDGLYQQIKRHHR